MRCGGRFPSVGLPFIAVDHSASAVDRDGGAGFQYLCCVFGDYDRDIEGLSDDCGIGIVAAPLADYRACVAKDADYAV